MMQGTRAGALWRMGWGGRKDGGSGGGNTCMPMADSC